MTQHIPSNILTEIEAACEAAGVTLIDLEVKGQHRQLRLSITIDVEGGIGHEHCRAVSRTLDERLAEDEFFDRVSAVDVSSPGAEAPVKFLWQLKKHVGRTIHVSCTDGSVYEGTLKGVASASVDIQVRGSKKQPAQVVTVEFSSIKFAHAVISFR